MSAKIYQLINGRDGNSGHTSNYFSSREKAENKIKELWLYFVQNPQRENLWEGYCQKEDRVKWARIDEHILF